MLATPILSPPVPPPSLEDFLAHPQDYFEWVNGQLIETSDMT